MLLTLAAVAVVLGVLIFVHEMGHFVAAKAVGIQVLRFSLGFGRPVLSWRRGETEYWISWLPLGGYVKMAGLEDEGVSGNLEGGKSDVPVDPARAFDRQPVWKRMIVVLAGVTINVVLAFIVYTGIAAVLGAPRLAVTQVDSVRTAGLPAGTAALGTLKFGDRITAINGDSVRTWDDVVEHFLTGPADLRVRVAGREAPIELHLPATDSAARAKAVQAIVPLVPARIGFVVPGQPAARAGLRPGDVIVRVDQDSIRSWSDMLHKIWYAAGRPLRLTVLRDGRTMEIAVTPEPQVETDSTSPRPKTYGVIGAQQDPPITRSRIGFGRALAVGADQTATQAAAVVVSVKKLLFRQASIKEVGGARGLRGGPREGGAPRHSRIRGILPGREKRAAGIVTAPDRRDRPRIAGDRRAGDCDQRPGLRHSARGATIPETVRSSAAGGGGSGAIGRRDAGCGIREGRGDDASRIPHLASRVLDPVAVPRLRFTLTTTRASAPATPREVCRPPPRDRRAARTHRGSGRPDASRDIS